MQWILEHVASHHYSFFFTMKQNLGLKCSVNLHVVFNVDWHGQVLSWNMTLMWMRKFKETDNVLDVKHETP